MIVGLPGCNNNCEIYLKPWLFIVPWFFCMANYSMKNIGDIINEQFGIQYGINQY